MICFSTHLRRSSSSGEPFGAVVPRLGGHGLVPRPSELVGEGSVELLDLEVLVDSLSESCRSWIPSAARRACFWLCLYSLFLALFVKRLIPSKVSSSAPSFGGWMTHFWLARLTMKCACSSIDPSCWNCWSMVEEWPLWCSVLLSTPSMGPFGCAGAISSSRKSESSSISSRIVSRIVRRFELV